MNSPLRILILEDVPMDAELVEYELEKARIPFELRRAETREEFLAVLDEFAPDIVLSDYTLPSFDGMSALFLARERAPDVPFIVVTGSVNEETAVRCMKAGATDYLLKNNLARIGPAIEAALERERARAEKHRAEAALAASERRFRSLVQNSSDVIVVVQPDGTITYASDSAERVVGFLPAALVGRCILDLVHPDSRDTLRRALRPAPGEPSITGAFEVVAAKGDGSWVTIEAVPNDLRADPVIGGIVLNGRDVSERRRAERALRESEERYRDLFDNASDLICSVRPDGSFEYVNRAWRTTLGYSDDDIAGLRLFDLVAPAARSALQRVFDQVLGGERQDHVELEFVTRAGSAVVVEGSTSATVQDGRPAGFRGIFRNVTERKRIEDHLRRTERMQAAGKLAGGVAHEVNNMMTAVIGCAEFLMRRMEPGDTRRPDVVEILNAANRAAAVTRQLLAFTRQQFMQPKMYELNGIVAEMEPMLRRSLTEDKELQLRLSPDAGQIEADRAQLEQVLINLVLNARDAMEPGGRVTIETRHVELGPDYARAHPGVKVPIGSYVLLAVNDSGCGMDGKTLSRIFEPFFTTKPVGQGTGLGLSTVYGIVKQSGGFVWAYSEPGLGSTFKIYLPRVAARESVETTPPALTPPGRGSETVLVVEDEETVRGLACRVLRDYGYVVLEAHHGQDALEVVRRGSPVIDLIVSDVVMPVMGGRELAARLAATHPRLPILYTSGYTGEDVVQRGLLDPAAPFEPKPFAPEQLARRVRQMLDAKRSAVATG